MLDQQWLAQDHPTLIKRVDKELLRIKHIGLKITVIHQKWDALASHSVPPCARTRFFILIGLVVIQDYPPLLCYTMGSLSRLIISQPIQEPREVLESCLVVVQPRLRNLQEDAIPGRTEE